MSSIPSHCTLGMNELLKFALEAHSYALFDVLHNPVPLHISGCRGRRTSSMGGEWPDMENSQRSVSGGDRERCSGKIKPLREALNIFEVARATIQDSAGLF